MDWTRRLPDDFVLAPDGSEVRPLLDLGRGGLGHCQLPPGAVSLAVRHKTIEEIWYVIDGRGQLWRKLAEFEEVVDLAPGVCVTIPTGAHFQFRGRGDKALTFIMATMPPWPGADEAVRVPDHWSAAE
ncbi:MAG: cupin domain-containing protein [Alphaproteobacteria bacterium]|nr:cupin domain-containing protein [Alphaproteobacteria bacterium]MDP6516179.1 cupin domain-containing protein [Alphaproteobacteria bacterium]